MIAAIHSAVKDSLDNLAYSNVFEFSATSIANVLGGTAGNVLLNPVYEFSYKMTRPDANTINVYARTGEDGRQQETGLGGIVVRSFDIPSRRMLSDRVEVYNDPDYCVFEHGFWDRPDGVWIYTYERLRSDVNNAASARVCLLKSTDGKIGRVFAAPVVQSWSDYVIPLEIHAGSEDGTEKYLYVGQGSPAGLRRAEVTADGTLGPLSQPLVLASGLTEASIVDMGGGVLLGVVRLNSGGYLQQTSSVDYGATWSGLSSTGIGASTGAKVTPALHKCANRNTHLVTTFNDRGASNRDRASSGNAMAAALAGSWVAPTYIGTPSTQGNCSITAIDIDRGEYLYCTAQQTGSPVVTNLIWWVFRDNYSVKRQFPAPWR